jgi:hypothetical protein
MHAWDQPAETLLRLGPAMGAQLVMPRLGQPTEPAQPGRLEPWWRGVDHLPPAPVAADADKLPPSMSWPLD